MLFINKPTKVRQRANSSNAIVAVVNHAPMLRTATARSPDGPQSVVAALTDRIETLEWLVVLSRPTGRPRRGCCLRRSAA
jgi:hypothetical protein